MTQINEEVAFIAAEMDRLAILTELLAARLDNSSICIQHLIETISTLNKTAHCLWEAVNEHKVLQ